MTPTGSAQSGQNFRKSGGQNFRNPHRAGGVPRARDLTIEALKLGLPLAAEDASYSKRIAQLGQNAIALTALAGDRAGALRMQTQFADLLNPSLLRG
jgi:hypothetical protein